MIANDCSFGRLTEETFSLNHRGAPKAAVFTALTQSCEWCEFMAANRPGLLSESTVPHGYVRACRNRSASLVSCIPLSSPYLTRVERMSSSAELHEYRGCHNAGNEGVYILQHAYTIPNLEVPEDWQDGCPATRIAIEIGAQDLEGSVLPSSGRPTERRTKMTRSA